MGDIKGSDDISAIGKIGKFLVIGSDESVGEDDNENYVQFLRKVGENRYEVSIDHGSSVIPDFLPENKEGNSGNKEKLINLDDLERGDDQVKLAPKMLSCGKDQ